MKASRLLIAGWAMGLSLCLQAWADDYATPNTGVCWDLDSLVAQSGGIVTGSSQGYVFHGSVTISTLDTVVIESGMIINFVDVLGAHGLSSEGVLLARGTETQPITFTSQHHTPGDWRGILLSQGVLDHCRVEYAHTGITVASSGHITNCTVASNQEGIRIAFLSAEPALIGDNLIADNLSGGIFWDGGIDRGKKPDGQDLPLIEGNQIRDNRAVGLDFAWGTEAMIRGNLITGHEIGIRSGPYDASMAVENTIAENDIGVQCDYDLFSGSLSLGDLSNQSCADDGGNHLSNNLQYDLYNASAESVRAEGNRWGTSDPATIDDHIYDDEEDVGDADGNGIISGPVDFLPTGETGVQRTTWGQIKSRFK